MRFLGVKLGYDTVQFIQSYKLFGRNPSPKSEILIFSVVETANLKKYNLWELCVEAFGKNNYNVTISYMLPLGWHLTVFFESQNYTASWWENHEVSNMLTNVLDEYAASIFSAESLLRLKMMMIIYVQCRYASCLGFARYVTVSYIRKLTRESYNILLNLKTISQREIYMPTISNGATWRSLKTNES